MAGGKERMKGAARTPRVFHGRPAGALACMCAGLLVFSAGCGRRERGEGTKGALYHYRLAAEKYRAGDFDAAVITYEKALQLNPALGEAHLDLGIIYDDYLRDKSKAIAHYREFLRLEPKSEKGEMVRRWLQQAEQEGAGGGAAAAGGAAPAEGATATTAVMLELQRARDDLAAMKTENEAYLKTVSALREELVQARSKIDALSEARPRETPPPAGAPAAQEASAREGQAAAERNGAAGRAWDDEKRQLLASYLAEKSQFEKALKRMAKELEEEKARNNADEEMLKRTNEKLRDLKKPPSTDRASAQIIEILQQKLSSSQDAVAETERKNRFYLKDNQALLAKLRETERQRDGYRAQAGVSQGGAKVKADAEREKEDLRQRYERRLVEMGNSFAREKSELQKALAEARRAARPEAAAPAGAESPPERVAGPRLAAREKAEAEKEALRQAYERKLAEAGTDFTRERGELQRQLAEARKESLHLRGQIEKSMEIARKAEQAQVAAAARYREQYRKDREGLEQRIRREAEALRARRPAPGASLSPPAAGRAVLPGTAPPAPSKAGAPPPAASKTTIASSPGKGVSTPAPRAAAAPGARMRPNASTAAPPAARYYKVARGDSLQTLAARFYGAAGRWKIIYDANRRSLTNPGPLRPGQVLLIP